MEKQFISFSGEPYTVPFVVHDINKYDVLFHVTLKETVPLIEQEGLLIGQEVVKSLISTGMLFLSYPIDMNLTDTFRWHDNINALVVLDAKLLSKDGFIFYDDYWSSEDQSSNRNHLMIEQNIPAKYIKKIMTW